LFSGVINYPIRHTLLEESAHPLGCGKGGAGLEPTPCAVFPDTSCLDQEEKSSHTESVRFDAKEQKRTKKAQIKIRLIQVS